MLFEVPIGVTVTVHTPTSVVENGKQLALASLGESGGTLATAAQNATNVAVLPTVIGSGVQAVVHSEVSDAILARIGSGKYEFVAAYKF